MGFHNFLSGWNEALLSLYRSLPSFVLPALGHVAQGQSSGDPQAGACKVLAAEPMSSTCV